MTIITASFSSRQTKTPKTFASSALQSATRREKNWKDFIAHNPSVKIDDIDFFKDYAVVSERRKRSGISQGNGFENETRRDAHSDTPKKFTRWAVGAIPNSTRDILRYNYASMMTPNSTYEYNFATGKSELVKQQEIPSGYDKTKYETKRVWATARDGVKVPISVVMKKGTKLDGSAPMLLYAYGSYGFSMTPGFSTARLSLVDRGMIYAIAHIRGGSELGEKWRQDGQNV